MKSIRDKIIRATALLIGLQFLTYLAGLLKQVLIAAQFGASETMDAYLVAITLVGLIQLWFAIPVKQTLVPLFRYDLAAHGEKGAWTNASILFNNLAFLLIIVALLGGVLAPYLVGLIAPGFETDLRALAASLVQVAVISIVFAVLGKVLSQLFFSHEKFFLPGTMNLVNNLVVILGFLVLSRMYGIYGLAIAVVFGAMGGFISQLPILWKKRKLYSGTINLRHPGTREMGKLSFPLFLSNSGVELARITDRIFASLLPAGSLSALAFAHHLLDAPLKLILKPLQQSTFPHFAKLSAEGNFQTLSSQYARYLRVMFFLTLPLAIGIMVTAEPIVRVLYQRGAFDETAVRLTSQALLFYILGLPALAMSRILNKAFYSLKDTWTPAKATFFAISVKILLSWVLIQPFAHVGLALAESLALIARTIFLFFLLPSRLKGQEMWGTIQSFARTVIACVVMGVGLSLVKGRMAELFSVPFEICALALLGVMIYGVMTIFFHREEAQTLLGAWTAFRGKVPVVEGKLR